MLVTPPTSHSAQSVSVSAKNELLSSSVSTTPNITPAADAGCAERQPPAISSSCNTTLIINGPPNNRFLSANQSSLSQSPDQDWLHSLSSSSSRLSSQHTTPRSAKSSDTKLLSISRRVSCPVSHSIHKKADRFHWPNVVPSSVRGASTITRQTKNPARYKSDILHSSKRPMPRCLQSSSINLPVANPLAASALVEDDKSATIDELTTKSITLSPLAKPKYSKDVYQTSECSTDTGQFHDCDSKAILNVGGVRHEGMADDEIFLD